MDEAYELLREGAQLDPLVIDFTGYLVCPFCKAHEIPAVGPIFHEPGCWWVRIRALTGATP